MTSDAPGGRIHSTDPFATPEDERSAVRRLRGRLAAPVTLWTAAGSTGPAGLTVSSVLVADGDPGRVLGLVDDESDLWAAAVTSGRFAVTPLTPADRRLADRFAGLMPAPGGLFAGGEWLETGYGPVPARSVGRAAQASTTPPEPGITTPPTGPDTQTPATPAGPGITTPPAGLDAGVSAAVTWVGCRLESHRPCGWAVLVEAVIETVTIDTMPAGPSPARPLIHYRGRYAELAEPAR